MKSERRRGGVLVRAAGVAAGLGWGGGALGGGAPENVMLIANPTSDVALRVANYYLAARDVPGENVLYISPQASDYVQFAEQKIAGFTGTLANRRLGDHIDYVLVMPGAPFFVSDAGLLSGQCFEPKRFSMGTAFGSAPQVENILDGFSVSTLNGFFGFDDQALHFDSNTTYFQGQPSDESFATRAYIGGMLGWTGSEEGNTVEEILDLIDRSVAVDGTFPSGTFYFMDNVSDPARNVRAVQYPDVTASMDALGATTKVIVGALPNGEPEPVMGLVSGFANNSVVNGDFTITPGAFCDHLTSFAGKFDTGAQTKMSEWITKGASGSSGTVEEPCNFPLKFPHSRMHLYYFQGLSLGEAWMRSIGWPSQVLLYGDPMTRPFTHIPVVDVPDAPTAPVAGTIVLTPEATTTHPTGAIESFELLVDGVSLATAPAGGALTLDTTALDEGVHEVRVLAFDDTDVRAAGRWVGSIDVDNAGGATPSLAAKPAEGDLSTLFTFEVSGEGGGGESVRLVHNGRVVASGAPGAPVQIFGRMLGAGPVRVRAEVIDASGAVTRTAPVDLDVTPSSSTPGGPAPVAFAYDAGGILDATSFVVELPTSFADSPGDATWTIVQEPEFATIVSTKKKIPYRVLTVDAAASPGATDSMTFRVNTPSGESGEATVTWTYLLNGCTADLTEDGELNIFDFITFQAFFQLGEPAADFNGDSELNVFDFIAFQSAFAAGCEQ